jgi:hypothetical protein
MNYMRCYISCFRSDDFNLANMNFWFNNFLVSNNSLSLSNPDTTMYTQLFVRFDILFICENTMKKRIVSLREFRSIPLP